MPTKTIQLDAMPSEKVKTYVEEKLTEKKINVTLNSIAENEIELIAKKNLAETIVKIHRDIHKPLQITVNVDYLDRYEEKKDINRMQKMNQKNSLFSMRYLFYYVIVFGIGVFAIFAEWFKADQNRQYIIFAAVGAVMLLIILKPFFQSYKIKQSKKLDTKIFAIITQALQDLSNEKSAGKTTIKCWACFKDIPVKSTYCEFCGEVQKNV